jgi:hypothetical protein
MTWCSSFSAIQTFSCLLLRKVIKIDGLMNSIEYR